MYCLIPNAFAQLCLSLVPSLFSTLQLIFFFFFFWSCRSISSKALKLLMFTLFPWFFIMTWLFSPFLPVQILPILQSFYQGPFPLPCSLWGLHLVGESEVMVSYSVVLDSCPRSSIRKSNVTF